MRPPQAAPQAVPQPAPAVSTAPTEAIETTILSGESSAIVNTKVLKVNTPDEFHGEWGKLNEFLLQCELYVRFNVDYINNDTDKILYITIYLRGKAAQWICPYLKDYCNNAPDNREDETNRLFASFKYFWKKLNNMFGEIDEKQKAQMDLESVKQKGSAAVYAADFQWIAFLTSFDDKALKQAYY